MICSPSDRASAMKIVPTEDFNNNLVVSQANFIAPDDNKLISQRRSQI